MSWERLKAKLLLRRSSAQAATNADPELVPTTITSTTTTSTSPFHTPHRRSLQPSPAGFPPPSNSRSCRSVSSLSFSHLPSDPIPTPGSDESQDPPRCDNNSLDGHSPKSSLHESPRRLRKIRASPRPLNETSPQKSTPTPTEQPPRPLPYRAHSTDRASLAPELIASSGFNELSPISPSTPQTPDSVGLQLFYNQGRERLISDKQSIHSLDAVVEDPSRQQSRSVIPPAPVSFPKRPSLGVRRQSLFPPSSHQLISSLLETATLPDIEAQQAHARFVSGPAAMNPRKIWVRRPGGSATLLPAAEDALVDELRDQVILKYANSLGRTFDSPDITIRVTPRDGFSRQTNPDRILSPEEPLITVVDSYYPGGQMIEDALIIDIPQRRTPKPSPRHTVYYNQTEPGEHGEYFPIMPVNANVPTPPTHPSNSSSAVGAHPAPSISILTTGMVPPLPSPGSRPNRQSRRPPLTRHTTNSPTMLGSAPNVKGVYYRPPFLDDMFIDHLDPGVSPSTIPPAPAPTLPTPPGPPPESPQTKTMTPPARVTSPRPRPSGKTKKGSAQSLNAAFGGLIEGTVPPINVLIVEDNIINQRLLEAFMKRLSVRWKCAANGEEAVKKWRQGGFHLVLMDIQLPVMNGLEATKEIRRLERLNGIGVFPKTASGRSSAAASTSATSPLENSPDQHERLKEEDDLHDLSLFKSPVIIVALTASSLQSDRHEALAAGCNDFLTKPVRFEWLEQKVTEWGCMQALIDFEGWRKWRGFIDSNQSSPTSEGHTSPMQMGNDAPSKKSSSAVDLPSRRLEDRKTNGTYSRLARSKAEAAAEDSSGSGSGEGADSPDSPITSVPVGEEPDGL
ncbi:ssk1 response regulator receiver [Aspergillus nanangensis]|uniref:Ssk1 response regulator receiver n=1 Tax=Aspergillus nanangensis TaxID=2582783 RepID=A0AAD4CYC7_ASPNN|nr:ssk1 response regulator receiver [Aspergillus nanangensis]